LQKENLINVPEKYYPAAAGIGYLIGEIRKEKPVLPPEILEEGLNLEKLFESIEIFKGMNPELDNALIEYKVAREKYDRFIVNFTAEAILDKKQSIGSKQEDLPGHAQKITPKKPKKQNGKDLEYV